MTHDYPYRGVSRTLLKDWSELKSDENPRYTIDGFNCFYGKRIKPTLKASFTSTGFPCIANISSKMLKRHCSTEELSTLCADHVVLIIGLDLSSKNVNSVLKGTDVESYTQRFQELVLLCSRMVPEEFDKVEKYTGGLPDNIQASVMASKPKMLQEAIELARSLMDQKNVDRAYTVGPSEKKEYAGTLPLCNK
ncbi:hypothetical protein Tco_0715860 [Tanacetum coccineum]